MVIKQGRHTSRNDLDSCFSRFVGSKLFAIRIKFNEKMGKEGEEKERERRRD